MRGARRTWGFLVDRIDARIAVSRMAAQSAQRWLGTDFEIIPNGVTLPDPVEAGGREHQIVFVGRHEARKGLPVLLRAWPDIRRRSGARLRLIGTDPLQYRLLHSRLRFDEDGIDVLGIVSSQDRDRELASAKLLVSPALGGESFGMVLVEAFAQSTPVVASNIPGFAEVAVPEAADLVPPGPSTRSRTRSSPWWPTRSAASEWGERAGRWSRSATAGRRWRAGSTACTSGSRHEGRPLAPARAGGVAGGGGVADLVARSRLARGRTAFSSVGWPWVVLAVALNLLSVLVRAAGLEHGDPAGDRAPAAGLPPGVLGLLRGVVRQCGAPGPRGRGRRAWPCSCAVSLAVAASGPR